MLGQRILLQTTIVDISDDWNVGRFTLLADELRRAGYEVTARNRDDGEDDSMLSGLDTLDYDELWLIAVDAGDGVFCCRLQRSGSAPRQFRVG